MEKVVGGLKDDSQRGQYVDSLHQGWKAGVRQAQDKKRGSSTRKGNTGEEEELITEEDGC